MQWVEDEKLQVIFERRRVEGGSLQAEVLQKVLDLVVHGRMSQGEKATKKMKRRTLKDGPLMKQEQNKGRQGGRYGRNA